MEEIINKVAKSGLVTLELEQFYTQGERKIIDIREQLWQGLVLREKEFREWIKTNNWQAYQNSLVAVTCTADAIVPQWAYMLIASALSGIARKVVFGSEEVLETVLFSESLACLDATDYADARVVVKGCGDKPIPPGAYMEVVSRLQPVVRSIMFGEPCSTVPVYKRT
jgi:hypothetical protein